MACKASWPMSSTSRSAVEIVVDAHEFAFRKQLDRLPYTFDPLSPQGAPLDLGDRIKPLSLGVGR